jgi:hypothetical protein
MTGMTYDTPLVHRCSRGGDRVSRGEGERGITVIFEDRNYSLYFFHMKTIYIQNLKKLYFECHGFYMKTPPPGSYIRM